MWTLLQQNTRKNATALQQHVKPQFIYNLQFHNLFTLFFRPSISKNDKLAFRYISLPGGWFNGHFACNAHARKLNTCKLRNGRQYNEMTTVVS